MLRGPSVKAMTFDEYKHEVCRLALKMNSIGKVCTDTIRASFERKIPCGQAALRAAIDTEFWEGGW